LQRGIELIIGYGFGESKEQEEKFVDRFKKFMTSPKKSLGKFHIYRVGDVHSKVLICDSNFMIISSFNWLSFAGDPTRGSRVEDGMLTKDQMAIDQKTQEWLERFDKIAHQERNGTQAAKV
jgi:phosphatidylserine/phosphatidylglycerophosphate/cardiolipin synthase-like enzyme